MITSAMEAFAELEQNSRATYNWEHQKHQRLA